MTQVTIKTQHLSQRRWAALGKAVEMLIQGATGKSVQVRCTEEKDGVTLEAVDLSAPDEEVAARILARKAAATKPDHSDTHER